MDIALTNLTKRYGDHAALDALSLSVSGARVLALIGPSGGGKSTLLRVLGGLEAADAGEAAVNGEPLPGGEDGLLAHRRRNGFLFQSFNLFPHLLATENIALPLEKVHGWARRMPPRGRRSCSPDSGWRTTAGRSPRSSPAASSSASPSPARWRIRPRSYSSTNRPRRSIPR
ncbi:MAG: ATP-binding cassette domain-containing protein [Verrucomicrobiales bacterium]